MTQVQLDDLIMELCREVGEMKHINIEHTEELTGTWGPVISRESKQPAGAWTVNWEQKGQEYDCILTLTYWFSPDEPHDEKIELPSPFHLTQNQREEFINSMIEKIEMILKQSK